MRKLVLITVVNLLCFICIYYRPIYLCIFLILFSIENLYFANYAYKFLSFKRQENYRSFQCEHDIKNDASAFELWLSINNVMAYKRLYVLCLKKKTNLFSLFSCFCAIALGIPLKLLKILFFFFKRKGSLESNLLEYYYINYNDIIDKKIEIINKKVYLNCSTRVDILKKIHHLNKDLSAEEICDIYKNLIKINCNSGIKDDGRMTEFVLGSLETEEGVKIKKGHWSHISNEKINGDKIKTVTHATSLVSESLTDTQFSGIAMKNLILRGSPKPGTVFTVGNFKFTAQVAAKPRYIPSWQFEYAKYDVSIFIGNPYLEDAFFKTETDIRSILEAKATTTDIREFSSGRHDLILLADSIIFNKNDILADAISIKKDWI